MRHSERPALITHVCWRARADTRAGRCRIEEIKRDRAALKATEVDLLRPETIFTGRRKEKMVGICKCEVSRDAV